MKEANRAKFYLAKYFFMGIGLLQWLVAVLLAVRFEGGLRLAFAALVFFTSGLVFISLQLLLAAKLKRVAVGKNKVAVIESKKTRRYKWPEVKSLRLIPFFNLYSMKVKGRKDRIYFLPAQNTAAIYGLFPTPGEK